MFDDDDGEGAVGLNDYLLGVVRKNAWGSPGGKVKLAKTLLPMLAKSTHDTYTEVFAGSGSVFFRKDRVPVEALNDYNPEIAQALKTIQDLTDSDVSYLSKLGWVADKGRFNRLAASDPEKMSKVERLHRHMYLTRFSFGYMVPAGFNTKAQGEVTKIWKRVEKARERLKGVKIYKGDYEIPARKHDGASSLHFLDPPYSGYNAAILEGAFDEHRFMKFMQSLEGNFLLTYGVRGELPKLVKGVDKWLVKRITPLRTFGSSPKMGSYAGAKGLGTLIVTNYDMRGKTADASLRKQGYDVADLDDDEAIAKMFVGYQPTPTWEMATISRMGSRVARSVGADLDRYEPLLKKLQDREPLSDNDVLTLANEVALLKSLGRNAEKQFAALGGTATEVWCSEALEDIIERDERVGKRYHSIGFDGRESVMPETVVVMRDCLTATRDGQLVCRSAEIIDAVEKSIPTLGLVDGTGAESAVYEHMPLYDLVLVPSARFGEIQRVQKVLADFDLTPGDHGELSLQTWGGAAGDLKMRLWKEGEDHWQGGAISKGLRDLMAAKGGGAMATPVVAEVRTAVGDRRMRGGMAIVKAFTADVDSVEVEGIPVREVERMRWVAGDQSDGHKTIHFDGELLKGRYSLVRAPLDVEVTVEPWGQAYVEALPDESFLWVEDDKVEKRSRLFPVRGADGALDVLHLKNAIARAPLATGRGLDDSARMDVIAKATALLSEATAGLSPRESWVLAKFWEPEDRFVSEPVEKRTDDEDALECQFEILKSVTEKRYVLGPVLIPERFDLQGDIVSHDEIAATAHKFMVRINEPGSRGVMHKDMNRSMQIVESYIAPVDFTIGTRKILKGTWLMAFHILDDEIWERVKNGGLRGFSIGGRSKKIPADTE